MQGKLYQDSSSIYEDEARILFDYFSQAADRIIDEEDKTNKRIEDAKESLTYAVKECRKKKIRNLILLIVSVAAAIFIFLNGYTNQTLVVAALAALFLILFISSAISGKKKIEEKQAAVKEGEEAFSAIRRSYKVDKLGVAYVPVAKKIPFGNQSITVDLSGAVQDEDFELITINNPEKFESDVNSFKKTLSSVPFVEGSKLASNVDTADFSPSMQEVPMYDYLASIRSDISGIENDLKNVDKKAVSIPVISPASETMEFLSKCGTVEPEDYPVVNVFDSSSVEPKLSVLLDIYNQRKNTSTGDEKALENLISFIGVSAETITGAKMNCAAAILEYNNGLFANVLKSPYRNFSPKLEAETIEEIKAMNFNFSDMAESYRPFKFKESSLMKFDLYSGTWIDETGGRTSMPFGLHQIQEEIFMPIVNNLMEENRIERRKIYERIQTQKLEYLNKWHTETQDFYGRNRDTADSLKSNIIEALSSYNSAYATWKAIKDTINKMDEQQSLLGGKVENDSTTASSMIIAADQVNKNFKQLEEDFDAYMERLQDDIDEKADKFGRVTYYEAFLYASEAQKAAVAAGNVSSLDQRQLKVAKVSPYLAEYGTLPPQPKVDGEVYEIMDTNLAKEAENLITRLRASDSIYEDDEAESDEEEHPDVEDIVFTDEDGSIGDETEITDDSSDEDDKE